jgi:hypothetical protein
MTSKYKYKIMINRSFYKDELENIKKLLENSTLLEFKKQDNKNNIERILDKNARIRFSAYGYISNNTKYVKLTNTQRKQLLLWIDKASQISVNSSIVIASTEYIDSLPEAKFSD